MATKQKKLFGLVCLSLVIIMTTIAYFLPTNANAEEAVTDTIRVKVYNQYPSVTIQKPIEGFNTSNPVVKVKFDYENSEFIDFYLTYTDNEGTSHTYKLPQFIPDGRDDEFNIATGSGEITIDLKHVMGEEVPEVPRRSPMFRQPTYDLPYNNYVLTVQSGSAVGYAEDVTEFNYVPTNIEIVGTDETNNDPVVKVTYDNGIAKVELIVVDKDGNPVLDEPIVFEIDEPYVSGEKQITIPLGSYGVESGEYRIIANSYGYVEDEEGEMQLVLLDSPVAYFTIDYTQPEAPAIPDTGRFMSKLNIAKTDLAITFIIGFVAVALIAFVLLQKKTKNYRTNIRKRR